MYTSNLSVDILTEYVKLQVQSSFGCGGNQWFIGCAGFTPPIHMKH